MYTYTFKRYARSIPHTIAVFAGVIVVACTITFFIAQSVPQVPLPWSDLATLRERGYPIDTLDPSNRVAIYSSTDAKGMRQVCTTPYAPAGPGKAEAGVVGMPTCINADLIRIRIALFLATSPDGVGLEDNLVYLIDESNAFVLIAGQEKGVPTRCSIRYTIVTKTQVRIETTGTQCVDPFGQPVTPPFPTV